MGMNALSYESKPLTNPCNSSNPNSPLETL